MKARGVIHLDLDDPERFSTALGNLENFLKQIAPEESDLRVVANSTAVKFLKKGASGHEGRVAKLAGSGIRFLVCNNSLSKLGIDKSELLEPCEVVPAGIVELIRLQNEGFAYVKP